MRLYLDLAYSKRKRCYLLLICLAVILICAVFAEQNIAGKMQPGYTSLVSTTMSAHLSLGPCMYAKIHRQNTRVLLQCRLGKRANGCWSDGISVEVADALCKQLTQAHSHPQCTYIEQIRYYGLKLPTGDLVTVRALTQVTPTGINVNNKFIKVLRCFDSASNMEEVPDLRCQLVLESELDPELLPNMTLPSLVVYRRRSVFQTGFNQAVLTYSWTGRTDTQVEEAMLKYEPNISFELNCTQLSQQIDATDLMSTAVSILALTWHQLERIQPLLQLIPMQREGTSKRRARSSIGGAAGRDDTDDAKLEMLVWARGGTSEPSKHLVNLDEGKPVGWEPLAASVIPPVCLRANSNTGTGSYYLMVFQRGGCESGCDECWYLDEMPTCMNYMICGDLGMTVARLRPDGIPDLLIGMALDKGLGLAKDLVYVSSPGASLEALIRVWPKQTAAAITSRLLCATSFMPDASGLEADLSDLDVVDEDDDDPDASSEGEDQDEELVEGEVPDDEDEDEEDPDLDDFVEFDEDDVDDIEDADDDVSDDDF